jgi:adenine deaminase
MKRLSLRLAALFVVITLVGFIACTMKPKGFPDRRGSFKEVEFNTETKIRQELVLVALGKTPADLIIKNVNVLNVFTATWMPGTDVVIKGQRIAWVGPTGGWKGVAALTHDATGLWAVPGFGESHKHVESSHLSPEWEAALVVPLGNTWTIEASHEFSNVNGDKNVEFWLEARKHGSPLKIFPSLGSATPPTAYETGGGYYGYNEIAQNIDKDPMVVGLDEVMDWPAVWNPKHPGYQRIWENIQATMEKRCVVEGHGAGLTEMDTINAFSAAGLSSDHEVRLAPEAWDKLQRGIFLQLKREYITIGIQELIKRGIQDWSNVSVVTDDRDVHHSMEIGTTDFSIRTAIQAGAPVQQAYALASYYPARHSHIEHWVGSIAPGRYADVVLLSDPAKVAIQRVFADGKLASEGKKYLLEVPKIDWPAWATDTINIGHRLTADEFAIAAPSGRTSVIAAIQEPFYRDAEQRTAELSVVNGFVQRDAAKNITKVATIDRYSGHGYVGKMFWTGSGPKTPNSAVAVSVSHDLHNIIVVGSSDEAMALAANTVADLKGGWALVKEGQVIGTVRYEIGGLMTSRPPQVVADDLEKLYKAADSMEWIAEPGLPKRLIFSLITCSPFTWRLIVPYKDNHDGLVNLVTGEVKPILQ